MKTLTKDHNFVSLNQGATDPSDWTITSGSGWRKLSSLNFVSDTFFDLAGMAQREKTLFFEAVACQDFAPPTVTGGQPGDSIVLHDLMTSEPLTDAELLLYQGLGNFPNSGAGIGFQQTIYGRVRDYVIDIDTAQWGRMVLISDNQIGSMEPTASDRIYCYRIVNIATPFQGTDLVVASARYILRAEAKAEADHQYIMRLLRSYELQQTSDED